jgi:hypothetical protein
MIEVTNVIRAFPETNEGTSGINSIMVKSHWNDPTKIVILVEGCSITVQTSDLIAAIHNSANTARFV